MHAQWIPNRKARTKNVPTYRKEKYWSREIGAIDIRTGQSVVVARVYATPTTTYCVVWIHHNEHHCRGCGKADGGGYHKASAALAVALEDAGIVMSEDIDGRGEGDMSEAIEAVGVLLAGSDNVVTYAAHP